MISEQDKARILRFVRRCENSENYDVSVYLCDEKCVKPVKNMVNEYDEHFSAAEMTETEDGIFFRYPNGSIVQFFLKHPVGHVSHVIIVDNRIKEREVINVIKPRVKQYVHPDGNIVFQPKPIYIRFVEVKTNEQD